MCSACSNYCLHDDTVMTCFTQYVISCQRAQQVSPLALHPSYGTTPDHRLKNTVKAAQKVSYENVLLFAESLIFNH